LFLNRLHDIWMRVTQQERRTTHGEVEIFFSLDIPFSRTFRAIDIDRMGFGIAVLVRDSAGERFPRALEIFG
jgi:hypothetical protein